MDPLAFMAGVTAAAGACTGWRMRRRARRAELEAARLREELAVERHAASHDALTGLPNRRAFYLRGAELVADPQHHPLVAIVLDLDGFKQINDVLGHSAGDEVLVTIARRLSACAGRGLVARLGGDEFAGLLDPRTLGTEQDGDTEQHQSLESAADRLAEALAAPMRLAGQTVTVSASVGLVPVEPFAHLADAVHRADAAMYRAKGLRTHPPRRGHAAHPHVVHSTIRLGKPRQPSDPVLPGGLGPALPTSAY